MYCIFRFEFQKSVRKDKVIHSNSPKIALILNIYKQMEHKMEHVNGTYQSILLYYRELSGIFNIY